MNIVIDGHELTIDQIVQVSNSSNVKVTLCQNAIKKMQDSRSYVLESIKKKTPIYGINTGFGALSNKFIENEDLEKLQINILRSHCTGVGEAFSKKITRAIMLLRANCLSSGNSGVNPKLVQGILDLLNNDITPVVPSQGSVGASGDLAPLSHIAICLIGEGEVVFENTKMPAIDALKKVNISPITLGPKDGLALINGTAVMAALGSLAIYELDYLFKLADVIAAITLDGVKGTHKAFDESIHKLKPHPGQLKVAKNMRMLLKDSPIYNSHINCSKVQDPYSLRCIPQVHGASRQTLEHAKDVFNIELNSVTDNPLVFHEEDKVISGGNFHGQALALCMDYLAMGASEICNISERRIEKMMNPAFSEHPAFLVKNPGLNSGLMIAHVTAAALVSENKIHCHPASVDSVPTSTDKEDHVSMGVTSGIKLQRVVENLKHVLSIELLCATQAHGLLSPLKTTKPLESVISKVREKVPFIEEDRYLKTDLDNLYQLIDNRELLTEISGLE